MTMTKRIGELIKWLQRDKLKEMYNIVNTILFTLMPPMTNDQLQDLYIKKLVTEHDQ